MKRGNMKFIQGLILSTILTLSVGSLHAVQGEYRHDASSTTYGSLLVTSSSTATALAIVGDNGHKTIDLSVTNISTTTRIHFSDVNITSEINGFPLGGAAGAPNTASLEMNPVRNFPTHYFLLGDGLSASTSVYYIIRYRQ